MIYIDVACESSKEIDVACESSKEIDVACESNNDIVLDCESVEHSNNSCESQLRAGIAEVESYFHLIDELFSTYKSDSEVSRLRRGELDISAAHPLVQECWNNLLILRDETDGYFDPWAGKAGFDPSGYVKGWVSDHAVDIVKKHGATSIQINAAGDISLAGGYPEEGKDAAWKIGIRDPEDAQKIVKIFEIKDGAIATSGSYERGAHIYDPKTGMIAIGAQSSTVYGPDGGICEALATALMVAGRDGAYLLSKELFSAYGAWVIDRHSDIAWSVAGNKANTLSIN